MADPVPHFLRELVARERDLILSAQYADLVEMAAFKATILTRLGGASASALAAARQALADNQSLLSSARDGLRKVIASPAAVPAFAAYGPDGRRATLGRIVSGPTHRA